MPPHLARAALLLEHRRPGEAEREVRRALAGKPGDPHAHALLARCLTEQDRFAEAEAAAGEAVALAPDHPAPHRVLAQVRLERGDAAGAGRAADEAVRLDPLDADAWAVKAVAALDRNDRAAGLAAAETGLAADPEHVGLNNLRAIALTRLGRRDEAGATLSKALAENPDDPLTHANRGWDLLHRGEPKRAMTHFRESLRLDPDHDWARAGLVEAMKARLPPYRWLLAYLLWTTRLSSQARWGLVIGLWLGVQVLVRVADAAPALFVFVLPVVAAYVLFVLLSWIGSPVADLLLLFHPLGRHALPRDAKLGAALTGLTLAVSLAVGVTAVASGEWGLLRDALFWAVLAAPVSAVFRCERGKPRWTMAAIAGGLVLFEAVWTGLVVCGLVLDFTTPTLDALATAMLPVAKLFGWLVLAAMLAGNALPGWRVRRG